MMRASVGNGLHVADKERHLHYHKRLINCSCYDKSDKQYWLGIRIDGDAEILSRTPLSSVSNALALDGGAVKCIKEQQGEVILKAGTGTERAGKNIRIRQ